MDLYHELKVVKKLIQTGGAYFLDYFTTNVTMSTQYIDMLKAWWRHLEFPNWIFHISNISIIVTTWRSFSSKLYCTYIVLSINKKCVSVLSTLETESSAVHIAHKGKKLYSSCISFWDMVWLRFGRKDHMTRHAKKTHANFYDSSERLERTRLISTPLPGESLLTVLIRSHDQTLQGKRRRNLLLELRHLEKRGGYWTVCIKNVNGRENLRKL